MGLFFRKKKAATPPPEIKPLARVYNINNSYTLSGLKSEIIAPLAKRNEGFPYDYDELKDIYDIGDKVFEYELYARADRTSLSVEDGIVHVLIDGTPIGYINAKKSAEIISIMEKYEVKRINLHLAFGDCQIIQRNDNADVELYGDNDRKWVTTEYGVKPKGKIEISYDKPWD